MKMLLILSVVCALWGSVSCRCISDSDEEVNPFLPTSSEERRRDPNLPYASQYANYTLLIKQFQSKHVNITFTGWPELKRASPDDLKKVCHKWAPNPSNVTGTAEYAQDFYLNNFRAHHFPLDIITCDVALLDKKGKEFAALTYYLCEGDEPNTAFRFSRIFAWELSVNLFEKVTNVWDGTSVGIKD